MVYFLRQLRGPLIVVIAVYAIGIAGLIVIPGQDAAGQPAPPMSIFHAFYFLSYTATTIGFGELPSAFTDMQRLWVSIVIYLSVIGWAYLIARLIALLQDRAIADALRTERVHRRIRRLREPFYLICGVGETGSRLRGALHHMGYRCVVVDIDSTRIIESYLGGLEIDSPGLVGDAGDPGVLLHAGVQKDECLAVLALTCDDRANVAAAMAVRLLHPSVPVLARALSRPAVDTMQAFGTDHIINPFIAFGRYLGLAMQSPGSYRLLSWLTDLPGTTLNAETHPPRGHWIVCGYGRFGREVIGSLARENASITIIDPDPDRDASPNHVRGVGTDRAVLQSVRIDEAVGIVAGTDDDVTNLAIAMTARTMNRAIYVILRQNQEASGPLVTAFGANIVMFASEIVAHECLAMLRTPLLEPFLKIVQQRDDAWADRVVDQLETTLGVRTPELWTVRLTERDAPAIDRWLRVDKRALRVGELLVDPAERSHTLACVPLLVSRGDQCFEMPDAMMQLVSGDGILFAGRRAARNAQAQLLANVNVRDYVLCGRDIPGGYIWQWWLNRRQGSA